MNSRHDWVTKDIILKTVNKRQSQNDSFQRLFFYQNIWRAYTGFVISPSLDLITSGKAHSVNADFESLTAIRSFVT